VAPSPENVADSRREIIQPCARHDDCVPPAVSFLGYPQEFSTLVLAEFEVKSLPFDLNFLRFENAVHLKIHLSLRDPRKNWKQILFSSVPASSLAGAASSFDLACADRSSPERVPVLAALRLRWQNPPVP
jgi:hypothetical protein